MAPTRAATFHPDEDNGRGYGSAGHYRNSLLRVTERDADDATGARRKAIGRAALMDCDDDKRAIRLTVTHDDPSAWMKVKEGLFMGLTVHCKPGQRGTKIPIRAVLTDPAGTHAMAGQLKLAK